MIPFCEEEGIALTPYSPLASGRLSCPIGQTTQRLELDGYAKFKYDKTQEVDARIIKRVEELARRRGASMTEISLAWISAKVDAPVVGVTKTSNIDGAVRATEIRLSEEEMAYLEEPYIPHELVGVMAQNGKQAAGGVV